MARWCISLGNEYCVKKVMITIAGAWGLTTNARIGGTNDSHSSRGGNTYLNEGSNHRIRTAQPETGRSRPWWAQGVIGSREWTNAAEGTVELHPSRLDVFSQSLTDFRYGEIFENIVIGPRFDALLDGRGVGSYREHYGD